MALPPNDQSDKCFIFQGFSNSKLLRKKIHILKMQNYRGQKGSRYRENEEEKIVIMAFNKRARQEISLVST